MGRCTIANSDQLAEGDEIYVAGFPQPANNRNSDLDEFQFTKGMVSSRVNSVSRDGYGFTHTSLTYTGMGGGPVFNSNGQLVAVHCGGDRDSDNTALKTGFNWGIPINTFTKLAQQMGMNLGISASSSPRPRNFPNPNPPLCQPIIRQTHRTVFYSKRSSLCL